MLSAPVVGVVLLAAILHAGWNVASAPAAIVAARRPCWLAAVRSSRIVLLPFLPMPARGGWPYLLVSSAVERAVFRSDRRGLCARRRGTGVSADARRCTDADADCCLAAVGRGVASHRLARRGDDLWRRRHCWRAAAVMSGEALGGAVCAGQRGGDRCLYAERRGRCAHIARAPGLHTVAVPIVRGADAAVAASRDAFASAEPLRSGAWDLAARVRASAPMRWCCGR